MSILDEMKTINELVPLEILIRWACKHGAEFLGLNQLGAIAVGKKPGVNHITNLKKQELTPHSMVNRII